MIAPRSAKTIFECGAGLFWIGAAIRIDFSRFAADRSAGERTRQAMASNEVWPNGMPKVGQTARRSRSITPRDIELFTEISGDRNPLHYDEELAKATRF